MSLNVRKVCFSCRSLIPGRIPLELCLSVVPVLLKEFLFLLGLNCTQSLTYFLTPIRAFFTCSRKSSVDSKPAAVIERLLFIIFPFCCRSEFAMGVKLDTGL